MEGDRHVEKGGIVRGRRAPEKQRRAVELRHEMNSAEMVLWQHLRSNRCGGLHFRRQQVLDGFIADFYCHSAGLVVEVDGDVHEQQIESDNRRDTIMRARGLSVLRFRNEQVLTDVDTVLNTILQVAQKHHSD